jgi:hypothetical protein
MFKRESDRPTRHCVIGGAFPRACAPVLLSTHARGAYVIKPKPVHATPRARRSARADALQRCSGARGVLLHQAAVAGEQHFCHERNVQESWFTIFVKSLEAPLRRDMLAGRTRHLCASSLTVCPDGLQFDSFRLYNPSSRHLIHPVDLPFRVRFSLMSTSTRSKREAAWDSTHDTEHRLRSENLAFDIGEMRATRAHTIF